MTDHQTLPADETPSTPQQRETKAPHRILVVEDDGSIRQLNAEVLVRGGYAVDAAEDGAAGWAALQTGRYDLLITDNNMPKLTGVELLKKLHAARIDLPVIMATGELPTAEFTHYPWLQPAATLLKPYTVQEILRMVKMVLHEAESSPADPQRNPERARNDDRISQAGAPVSAPPPTPTNSGQRILVVDEDRDLCRLYAEALAGPGYHVDVAENGADGWAALQAKPYSLLITEHDLPKLTGVELVRKLRAAHMALPVVMSAGRLPTDELARHPGLLLAATLVKPFAVDALVDTVKNVLRATDRADEPIAPRPTWSSPPAADGLALG